MHSEELKTLIFIEAQYCVLVNYLKMLLKQDKTFIESEKIKTILEALDEGDENNE